MPLDGKITHPDELLQPDNVMNMERALQNVDLEDSIESENLHECQKAKFKILSIDGGGIKGLYVAKLLAQIERKTGKQIGDYFDMICGTSTGGLIGLGITNGISCEQLAEFYMEHGPLIFPNEGRLRRRWNLVKQVLLKTKYASDPLRQAIISLIGEERTMSDADHLLCIPAYNLTKGRPTVFKKPFGPYHRDGRFNMVDVALATSAAPTYLPAVTIEHDQYVDGGIFANNPSMIGLTEAVDHFVNQTPSTNSGSVGYNRISILSIGMPDPPSGESTGISDSRSFAGWGGKLINSAMIGISYITGYQVDKLVSSMKGSTYFRLQPPSLSKEQFKYVGMDKSSSKAIQLLTTYGQEVGDIFTGTKWPEVEHFFNNPKTFQK